MRDCRFAFPLISALGSTGSVADRSALFVGFLAYGGVRLSILDGRVEATGAVFEAKFMLPWSFSEEAAAEKHMPQLHTTCGWSRPEVLCCR